MATTSQKIAEVLRQRLGSGGYPENLLPSERDLAAELGVSRPTLRRALESMLEDDILHRQENGRLKLNGHDRRLKQIGYFYPSLGSWHYEEQYQLLSGIAGEFGMKIRPIYYDFWADPALTEGFEAVEAIILHPRPNIPDWLIRKLQNCGKPVWVLEYDYSGHGFPSLHFFPDRTIGKLLDYLASEGFRDMELINITPRSSAIDNRIFAWEKALRTSGGKGRFCDFSLADGHLPFRELRDIMRRRIQDSFFDMNRLILTTTIVGATVFLRAAADLGLAAGRDYSLASIGSEMHAEMNVPAITSIDSANPLPYFRRYLQWLAGGGPWEGELLWEADDCTLIEGESIIRKIQR